MSRGKVSRSNFVAPWWLSNRHTQTLWPRLFPAQNPFTYSKERLELNDGDFVDLCWTGESSGPLVAVFHGLEGSINSPYIQDIMSSIASHGWRGVFMHFRGCSGEFNRLDRNYHSGDTGDIEFLISTLRTRFPDSPLFAIAYSLGGNALLKYLGENRQNTKLDAAVAVSVPFLLDSCALQLNRGLSKFYQRYLLASLHKKTREKYRDRKIDLPLNRLDSMKTFHLFDDQITAPLHGFNGVNDYYSRSSCHQYLKNITTPTLIIQSKDDPFMTPEVIPEANEVGQNVELEITNKGGHVGFINGKYPWRAKHWLKSRIPKYIHSHLDKAI
ncbi:MAG: hydrolase [Gammaproteobacteria bacterium]|nr:hydrolase [Gammaproteobacteria bacterium]